MLRRLCVSCFQMEGCIRLQAKGAGSFDSLTDPLCCQVEMGYFSVANTLLPMTETFADFMTLTIS